MWALIRKEALENMRWLPLALLLTCSLTLSAVYNGWLNNIGPLISNTMYGSSLLALGFGLMQSIPDDRNAARAYLLHRGVSAAQVFWAKTTIGFAFVFVSIAIPLTWCALWLSMRGVLNGPGHPIQVLPATAIALTGFLFHPTVLLIINRPARWIGSRVAPILVPIAMLMFAQATMDATIDVSKMCKVVAWSLAALVVMIWAARRAYVDLARQPAALSLAHRSPGVVLVLVASMLVVVSAAAMVIAAIDQASRQPVSWYNAVLASKSDRQLWLLRVQDIWNTEKNEREARFLGGAPLTGQGIPDPNGAVPKDFAWEDGVQLNSVASHQIYGTRDIAYQELNSVLNIHRWTVLLDRRGYLLCYDKTGPGKSKLGQVVSRDGIHNPEGDWGRPFDGAFTVDHYRQFGLIGDRNGIYWIDESTGAVMPLVERPAFQAEASHTIGEPLTLFVRMGSKLSIFNLSDDSGPIVVPKDYGRFWLNGRPKATLIAQEELPELMALLPVWNVYYRSPEDWIVHGNGGLGAYPVGSVVRKNPGQKDLVSFTVEAHADSYNFSMRDVRLASVLAVPLPSLLTPLFTYIAAGRQQHKSLAEVSGVPASLLPGVVVTFLLQGLCAAALAWFMALRRGLSRRAMWLWSGLGIVLGWAVPLAVLACYPRIVCETCTHCQKPRRIDLASCEHCHGGWEQPQREGIEIIEHEFDGVGHVDSSRVLG